MSKRNLNRCKICSRKIEMMCRKHTGICSGNCERVAGEGKYATPAKTKKAKKGKR